MQDSWHQFRLVFHRLDLIQNNSWFFFVLTICLQLTPHCVGEARFEEFSYVKKKKARVLKIHLEKKTYINVHYSVFGIKQLISLLLLTQFRDHSQTVRIKINVCITECLLFSERASSRSLRHVKIVRNVLSVLGNQLTTSTRR